MRYTKTFLSFALLCTLLCTLFNKGAYSIQSALASCLYLIAWVAAIVGLRRKSHKRASLVFWCANLFGCLLVLYGPTQTGLDMVMWGMYYFVSAPFSGSAHFLGLSDKTAFSIEAAISVFFIVCFLARIFLFYEREEMPARPKRGRRIPLVALPCIACIVLAVWQYFAPLPLESVLNSTGMLFNRITSIFR